MSSNLENEGFRVAIVGGGIGGLALAIGLQHKGISVHVYEAAAQFSEIGAGVAFGSNAVRALELIDPALLSAYLKHATKNPPGAWLTYRYGMGRRTEASEQEVKSDTAVGEAFWKQYDYAESGYIHRARLLDEMVALVPAGTAIFNKRLVNIEDQPDSEVTLYFEDGTTATADAVVGCDGIKSSTRAFVCGEYIQPAYSGHYAYRQLFPRDVAIAALGLERAQSMTLECGYGGYIIHYPVEDGSLVNMTAVRHEKSPEWKGDTWAVPTSREAMLEDWKGWDARLLDLISHIQKPERNALFDLKHDKPYARGRVCLLGDSAHASTPHNGAGAAMAIEDAYVLSGLLSELAGPKDLEYAFEAYDSVRRPRSQRLVDVSRSSGLTKSFARVGIWDDVEKIKAKLEPAYRWIWDIDLEDQLREALAIMKEKALPHTSML